MWCVALSGERGGPEMSSVWASAMSRVHGGACDHAMPLLETQPGTFNESV